MRDKAQDMFMEHCREHLEMDVIRPKIKIMYWLAYDSETVQHKKKNAGLRSMNQYLYRELTKKGCQDWKPDKDGKKPQRRQMPKQAELTNNERRAIAGKATAPSKYQDKILRDAGLV